MGTREVDVLIVGAGISGIGAAYHVKTMCPNRTFAVVEGREQLGGTWDLFRYPGVRSDSDMHTLGYRFKPWTSRKAIADGPSILAYLRETVEEFDLARHITYGVHVSRAEWSSSEGRWTVIARQNGEVVRYSCSYLFMCTGYYRYSKGFEPDIPGLSTFGGTVVHPQFWPKDLDYAGKRVVVIGSGATAMTIVPSIAGTAAHVTMLQRSPTYVVARPDVDSVAEFLRKFLPAKLAYRLVRFKNTTMQQFFYKRMRAYPQQAKERLMGFVREAVGGVVDVDTHFNPTYFPWDQRLCLLPNGDLFEALKAGTASIVTDTIRTVDTRGIELVSGSRIDADIIVTATGLHLVTLGEVEFAKDGELIDFSQTWTYKGMSYSGVPNLATSFGYINASWTLRADLTCEYVCRLLNHMDKVGATVCTPTLREGEESMPQRPWVDGFTPGYMNRVMHLMPKQGDREPWLNPQDYKRDIELFRKSAVDDGVMRFTATVPV
jgi:cation diffusion facilitator CzcD-associated flavoprotein CzcO